MSAYMREQQDVTPMIPLDVPAFDSITGYLSDREMGICVLVGKLEAFLCQKRTALSSFSERERGGKGAGGGVKAALVRQVSSESNSNGRSSSSSSSSSSSGSSMSGDGNSISHVFHVHEQGGGQAGVGVDEEMDVSSFGGGGGGGGKTGGGESFEMPLGASVSAETSKESSFSSSSSSSSIPMSRRPRAASLGVLRAGKKSYRKRTNSLDETEISTRRLLIDLISTLNESFPDYDFTRVKPAQFVIQRMDSVMKNVNNALAEIATSGDEHFLDNLWKAIDECMTLSKCEVFSYVPDMNGDPFSEGSLWSFNYFFHNPENKQICYFSCVAASKFDSSRADTSLDMHEDEDEDFSMRRSDNDDDSVDPADVSDEEGEWPQFEGVF